MKKFSSHRLSATIPPMKEGPSIEAAPVRYSYACLAVAVSVVVYLGSLGNGFVYDDNFLITYNDTIKDLSNIPSLFTADMSVSAGEGKSNYYRPFMFLVFMADYHIFGLEPWGFHLSYIILHAFVTMGVFLLTSMVLGDARGGGGNARGGGGDGRGGGYRWAPLGAALLFATHPIHTQVVAWNGAHEMGMALFVILALYFYVQGRHVAGAVCFLCAAFFKETAMVLPAALIAWDASFKKGFLLPLTKDKLAVAAKRYLPYLSVAVIYMTLRTYALGGLTNVNNHKDLSVYEYMINVPPLFAKYLLKLVLPTSLSAAHTFEPIHSLLEWRSIIGLVVVAAFLAALARLYRSRGAVFFLTIFMVLPLLPVLYIPGLGVHVFAENYLYLPSVAFAVLSVIFVVSLIGKLRAGATPRLVSALIVAVALVYTVGTVKRVPVWKDGLTLWEDTIKKSPDDALVNYNLGRAYHLQGLTEKAIAHYEKTTEIDPYYAEAYNNLAAAYYGKGDFQGAMEKLRLAAMLMPENPDIRYNLASVYRGLGRLEEARKEADAALRISPFHMEALKLQSSLGVK